MSILIKLGGSLITDKTRAKTFRRESVGRIARQVLRLRDQIQDIRIIIGHGSGSFGHYEAKKYNTAEGVTTDRAWNGFVKVGAVAAELSLMVQREFLGAGLPVMRFQPSSSLVSSDKRVKSFDSRALALALKRQTVPLIHGDIALDERIGGTIISTESLIAHLIKPLGVAQVILLGDVDGVLDHKGALVPLITPRSLPEIRRALTGSDGIDVTGGMRQKVETMVSLVVEHPSLEVVIADGNRDGVLVDLLANRMQIGTRICADLSASPL